MRVLVRIVALLSFGLAAGASYAQTLLDTTLTLGKKPDAVIVVFDAAAGNYRITVTDFGTPAGPVRMSRVDAAVMRGSQLVTSANVTSANATGVTTKTFTATAGEHRLILIGQPAATRVVGSVGVRIDDPVSGAVLLDTAKVFTVPPAPTASPADFEHEFTVAAGTYTLEITDFALPQALAVLDTIVVPRSGGAPVAVLPGTPVSLTTGVGDTFEVFIHAELAVGAPRGLIGVNLRDTASGSTQASATHELGEWPYQYPLDVPSAATLTAALADLQFPVALTGLAGEIVRDGRRAASRFTAGANSTFAAESGTYTVYVSAAPSGSSGSFGLKVAAAPPAAALIEEVQSVVTPGPTTDLGAIDTFFDVQTAGDYTLTLTDFGTAGFFDAFTSINLALTRDNQIVNTLSAPGNFVFAATPGRYSLAIVADPASTDGEGLLGVRVRGGPGDVIVYDRTEAVGTDFISSTVDVTTAQSVDVRLTDLAFPADFDSIKVAVTRGAERVGEIVGAGSFSFPATPGTYVVNLLATPDAVLGYSTLGLNVSVTPPLPVVTLSASAASVVVGSNVTLTWSATNATACTASGGWSGSRATSGSTSVGPLNTDTVFTLTCTGPGGSDDAAANVAVTAAQRSGGGGGGVDTWLLVLLGIGVFAMRRRLFAAFVVDSRSY